MAAQAAVAAVRKGCEMLSEGKAEIGKLKSTVEKGIGDAKAIYKEVTTLWSWLLGLFGKAPNKSVETKSVAIPVAAPIVQKVSKVKEPELSYEEYQTQAIHQVCEQLKTFFEIRRKLREHCLELEEVSKTTTTIENSAIDRVEIELQLENMTTQIREAMVYAPLELRNIYSRFLEMYNLILEEQEFDRQLKRKTERDAKWQRELLRNHRVDRAIVATAVLVMVLWMWAFLLSLGWLVKTHNGLSLV
jgi:DNA-directed RNA polymerase subunit F